MAVYVVHVCETPDTHTLAGSTTPHLVHVLCEVGSTPTGTPVIICCPFCSLAVPSVGAEDESSALLLLPSDHDLLAEWRAQAAAQQRQVTWAAQRAQQQQQQQWERQQGQQQQQQEGQGLEGGDQGPLAQPDQAVATEPVQAEVPVVVGGWEQHGQHTQETRWVLCYWVTLRKSYCSNSQQHISMREGPQCGWCAAVAGTPM